MTNNTTSASLIILLMTVALYNQFLREHDMLTKISKFNLGVFMVAGFDFIYK